jgi:hypothetical protein
LGLPGDRVYSEADVADMRERWERSSKDLELTRSLAQITGQLQGMPELIRSISREVAASVVADVLKGQVTENQRRSGVIWDRWGVSIQLSLITAGLVYEIFFKH